MQPPHSLLDLSGRGLGWQRFISYTLLLSVTFALYGVTVYYGFVWDDFTYVVRNYRIRGLDWIHIQEVWTNTFLGHYAPVQHTFLAVVYFFSGLDPIGYHLGQLLVHAGCVCLLYCILEKMESPRVALAATLLFAVHPANIETVAWISETKSTLAFLFFLLSFWFFMRLRERERWQDGVLSGLFLILSVLAKINTVVAPAIFLAYDYRQGTPLPKFKWRSLAAFVLISGVFTGIHLTAFHGTPSTLASGYLGGPATHLMNLPLLLFFYLKMIVYPHPISAWEMMSVQLQWNWMVALGWVGFAGLAWILLRSRREAQFWGLWIFIFLLPVLQIIPFPIWVADRYLYIPAIGGFVIIARFFFQAADRLRRWPRLALEAAMLFAALLLAWATTRHLPIWQNDLTLWTATTPTCMTSGYCHMNLGLALLEAGQVERGMRELIRAVELRPGPQQLERLGDAYTLTAHDYRQAVIAYTMARDAEGQDPGSTIYAKLARVHFYAGQWEEARRAIDEGKRVNPTDPNLWIADGFVLWKRGMREEARVSLQRALAMARPRSDMPEFLTDFWRNPAEVAQILSDLWPSPSRAP